MHRAQTKDKLVNKQRNKRIEINKKKGTRGQRWEGGRGGGERTGKRAGRKREGKKSSEQYRDSLMWRPVSADRLRR